MIGTALLASPALAGGLSAATTSTPAPVKAASARKALSTVGLPTGFRPEGITSGPRRTFFAGSVADGRIWTGSLKTGAGQQLTAGVSGRSLRGLQWDQRSHLLWAAGQDGSQGIVLAVDATSGAVEHRIEVPGSVFLNDLVIEPNAVWVTDSRVDRLTRIDLRPATGHPTGQTNFITLKGAWPATTTGNGANGIDTLWDGTLLLNNSTHGGIYTVDPHTGETKNILVKRGPGITGGDGLERKGHTLFVVRGNSSNAVEALKLHHNRNGWRATWRKTLTSPQLDVPSTATFVNHTLWAVNARFGVADPATASYQVVPLGKKVMSGIAPL
ncbi:SMP-30/gluconolactonase/LRE family protein [Kineosporia mesophila]|uniref:SMP-30/gluconolactonase/LRE family protein n=1 Tax=Kineosporia mesophila TaxID=566012 RepID=A0ABP6Z0H3_9ACTN